MVCMVGGMLTRNRKLSWILSLVLGLALALILFRSLELADYFGMDLEDNRPVEIVRGWLLESLVIRGEFPTAEIGPGHGNQTLIYVLGGGQEILKWRIRLASAIYGRGLASHVAFLSVRGNTDYSPELGRNYTHDEWVTREMMKSGVKAGDIESQAMPTGYFGTLSEARGIADLVKKGGYRRLILVTSAYHTRRVLVAFSHNLKGKVELSIYGSDEKVPLHHLMRECIKLLVYRYLLVPCSGAAP